ncbi:hypothetical protein [Lachnobacterium bovis]|uniref:Uncharacterized protein n=2 Tax=Lachnobacterium bovis TaxID=140626 RepID=A0A1H3JFL8_9FIRM|nr:hypothetical protein [Lachnobacterium bovis]SDY38702.1 hypothetical protein SAMN02910414_01438 [Lachnobacterium bovis DSM 14045]SER70045.1 hypothetical protein SAMN02910429_00802 [Lachnobacterium bovis]
MLRLTIKILEKKFDIMVKKNQRIIEVLKVLKENQLFFYDINQMMVYSVRNQEYVNKKLTFKQGDIFSGDILELK